MVRAKHPAPWDPAEARRSTLYEYLRQLDRDYPQLDGNDILRILVGLRGPWLTPRPPIDLPFTLNRRKASVEDNDRLKAIRRRQARQNRQMGLLKGIVSNPKWPLSPRARQAIKSTVDSEKRSLPGVRRRRVKSLSREAFLTDLVVHLVEYVKRTTGNAFSDSPTYQVFRIVAKILNLASEGQYPSGDSGARRVKQRYWRAQNWV